MSLAPTDERPHVCERFLHLEHRLPPHEYNYEHFRTRHLLLDLQGTLERRGIPSGEPAPDFTLPDTGGRSVRLSDLRDRPVLLHFGSGT